MLKTKISSATDIVEQLALIDEELKKKKPNMMQLWSQLEGLTLTIEPDTGILGPMMSAYL